jgi:predicted PurR-regulated permease PerM
MTLEADTSEKTVEEIAEREAKRNPTAFEIVWQSVWVRATVQLVLLVGLLWLLIRFRQSYAFALQTAIIGFVIAYVLNPLVEGLGRIRIRRAPATVMVYILVVALFVFGTYLLTQVVTELGRFVNLLPRALNALTPLITQVSEFFASWQENLPGFLTDRFGVSSSNPNVAQEVEARIIAIFNQAADGITVLLERILNDGPGALLSGATGIFSTTLQVFLIVVASAYFLNDFPKITANFRRFVPLRYRPVYGDVVQKLDMAVGGYLRGQLLIAVVLGFFLYLGLILIGIPLALPISFLAAILNIVPYLGPIVGAVPAVLLALTTTTPFTSALLVVALFIVANQLEGNLLSPFILSKSTNLHPVTVLIAITLGLGIFGLVGAIFAVPAASLIKLMLETYLLKRRAYTGEPTGAVRVFHVSEEEGSGPHS